MRKIKSKTRKPYLIGITGSFGVGKSIVGDILKSLGVFVIDTDEIVSNILKTKTLITKKIVKIFGEEVVSKNKKYFIDKKILGELVFNNQKKRKMLESVIHPAVRACLRKQISLKRKNTTIAVLIPLLFESGQEKFYNEIWCVICNKSVQLKRLKNKGYSLKEAIKRINAQFPQHKKAKLSDFVIDNSRSISNTKAQVVQRLKFVAQLNRNLHLSLGK